MPDETGFGGAEDLVALLKQKQMQKPQQNLEGFLGGEREGTDVAGGEPVLAKQMINQIANIQRNMDMDDPNRLALEGVVDNITSYLGQSQNDRNKLAQKAFNKADNNFRHEDLAVDKTRVMKALGFE